MSVWFVTGASRGLGAQIDAAVQAAMAAFGRIDVLVDNAGRGLLGVVEEAIDADVRAVYDTNVFGVLAVTRAAQVNHGQPGDPAKAGPAIVAAIDSGRAPLRLQLGSDCVASIEAKFVSVKAELDAWRDVAVSTDYADVAAAS